MILSLSGSSSHLVRQWSVSTKGNLYFCCNISIIFIKKQKKKIFSVKECDDFSQSGWWMGRMCELINTAGERKI
jgi:hypothetical protein